MRRTWAGTKLTRARPGVDNGAAPAEPLVRCLFAHPQRPADLLPAHALTAGLQDVVVLLDVQLAPAPGDLFEPRQGVGLAVGDIVEGSHDVNFS